MSTEGKTSNNQMSISNVEVSREGEVLNDRFLEADKMPGLNMYLQFFYNNNISISENSLTLDENLLTTNNYIAIISYLSLFNSFEMNMCWDNDGYDENFSKIKGLEVTNKIKLYLLFYYLLLDFEQQKHLINELLRVTKYHVFYNIQLLSGNKNSVMKLMGVFADNIKEIIIWNKKNGVPAMEQGVFNSAYEYIIVFSNDQPNKRKFYDTEFRGTQNNVFTIKNTHSNPFSDVHKAIMPLDIPRYFMQLFGKEKDIWYDPYMGTGTTAVAAIEEKRKFIGSEISQEYIDLANKRLEPYLTQQTLF
jgi:DNA modification methylase